MILAVPRAAVVVDPSANPGCTSKEEGSEVFANLTQIASSWSSGNSSGILYQRHSHASRVDIAANLHANQTSEKLLLTPTNQLQTQM